ncbi:hypothetical protein CBL_20148, partial [Carabus blaptoides fortunei]
RVHELQLNGPVTSTKFKAPTFDGTVPFKIFKLQFETTASTNHWRDEDKVAALVVSLKGSAAEVLRTVSEIERDDYDALMAAIERRYGSEHRKQIFQMELLNRYQKANETLQEYSTEIERLAHLANVDAPAELLSLRPDDEWEPSAIRKSQLEDVDMVKLVKAKEIGERPSREEMSIESPVAKAYW